MIREEHEFVTQHLKEAFEEAQDAVEAIQTALGDHEMPVAGNDKERRQTVVDSLNVAYQKLTSARKHVSHGRVVK